MQPLDYPDTATGDVFRRLVENAFDFERTHEVEFFAIFPTEEAAERIGELYVADHRAGALLVNIETRPAETGGMELKLVKQMRMEYDEVVKFEEELQRRAGLGDGHFDGWGVLSE